MLGNERWVCSLMDLSLIFLKNYVTQNLKNIHHLTLLEKSGIYVIH